MKEIEILKSRIKTVEFDMTAVQRQSQEFENVQKNIDNFNIGMR